LRIRVISGSARGTVLSCPETDALRPTTDRVKENIFNLLQFEVSKRKVLDLFAGSGAMGIEALSRGAEYCLFCDSGRDAQEAVKANVKKTRMENRCRIATTDFESLLGTLNEKFSLVFLDPPYHMGYVEKAVKKLVLKNLLTDNAIIVAETDGDEEPGEFEGLKIRTARQYGRVKVTVYDRIKGCEKI